MHVGPSAPGRDAANAAAALREAGLARGCLLSPGYGPPKDCPTSGCPTQRAWTVRANDWTLAQARSSPGLLGFCGVPLREGWGVKEVRRCAAAGARGLKVHPLSEGVSLAEPKYLARLDRIAKAAGAAGLPILIHVDFSESEVRAFLRAARSRPETVFIAAHQLGPRMAALAQAPANVYVEVSGLTFAPPGSGAAFADLWRAVGVDRVLLGSDWPTLSPAQHAAAVGALPLTADERRAVIGENALRLLPPR